MGRASAIAPGTAIFDELDPSTVRAIERPEPLLRASRLAYIRFERPHLVKQRAFLRDFGITIADESATDLYGRGTGSEPFIYHARHGRKARFVGIGLALDSAAELEIAAGVPGAGPIEEEPGPGGGRRVTLRDPNGFVVELIHGREEVAALTDRPSPFTTNNAHGVSRPNAPVRPPLAAADVIKLGHVVLQCCDFEATLDWWMRHVGLIASDAQVLADGSVNLAFCRLDRGDVPADHHTVALVGGVAGIYMHSAFEVQDMEAVGQGQQVLKAGGWKHGWGIGRHYYGSQIFDYWRDPAGDLMEHYTDGDHYDATIPTRYSRFTRGSTWMWGQDQPRDFEGVNLPTAVLAIRNLLAGSISWARLKLVLSSLRHAPRPWLK